MGRGTILGKPHYWYGCTPKLVIISDDYKQYDTQETTNFYGTKASGILGFRNEQGVRKVLTTRRDGPIGFSFQGRNCIVYLYERRT